METKLTLKSETVEAINDLIQVNQGSFELLDKMAEKAETGDIQKLFRTVAADRKSQALELERLVKLNHEEADTSSTLTSKAHQWFVDVRTAIQGSDAKTLLVEAEKGEDRIKHAYEDTLKSSPATAVNDVLLQQYAQVKKQHDLIRDLRDAHLKT